MITAARKRAIRASVRKLLTEIYHGNCQISGFGFLTKTGKPYFEIHHLKVDYGDHLKNVLVVCPNVHAQFTHALVEEQYDEEGWLRIVAFNGKEFNVNQAIDKAKKEIRKEIHIAK